ncbi:alpha/beta hydrolase [Flavihumibacter petaseus]|uniref:Putative hydrolase n=1 Tax=Flavihumibacter petaseus NBRC 106054 TaxID=1220578 RepID=A0A0E9MUQ7_9BACT|nr:alpha/beta hydrolase [Flavihumibacter petaseus]GAO41228.1 putative hydrolase [Flavihumibacter petaseus NBRC 106054]
MKFIFSLFFFMTAILTASSQEVISLYPTDSIPNSKPTANAEKSETQGNGRLIISNITVPTMTVFRPEAGKENGTAVIICPGGGYWVEAFSHEGTDVAKVFTEWGVTAFVLKYRLPSDETMTDKTIGPLQDAQRAIQYVREHAKQYLLSPKQIGIMGFSAGGHLAGTATVHFDDQKIANPLKTSLRPDFSILVYPVIIFNGEYAHKGSVEKLLGKEPTPQQLKYFSLETQVTKKTPPVFLVHAKDDKAVKLDNTLQFADALDKANVKHDLYLYEKGGHGFGLHNPTSDVEWMKYVKEWMFGMDLILKKPKGY